MVGVLKYCVLKNGNYTEKVASPCKIVCTIVEALNHQEDKLKKKSAFLIKYRELIRHFICCT